MIHYGQRYMNSKGLIYKVTGIIKKTVTNTKVVKEWLEPLASGGFSVVVDISPKKDESEVDETLIQLTREKTGTIFVIEEGVVKQNIIDKAFVLIK